MTIPTPRDPDFAARIRDSFARQAFMATIGATLERIEPGLVEIGLERRDDLGQQHGFLHAGVLAAVADSACGYAAATLMPADAGVLSVEFKINLMAPARGQTFLARGRVLRAGRTISTCLAEVLDRTDEPERPIASMLGTMMTVQDRPGIT